MIDPAHRPAWLLNITNDAWYGFTSGPFQHLAIARMRAVEEGLPLVRVGNNGDFGRLRSLWPGGGRLDLDAIGVLDEKLPDALPVTWYERWRDGPLLILILLVMVNLIGTRLFHGQFSRKI